MPKYLVDNIGCQHISSTYIPPGFPNDSRPVSTIVVVDWLKKNLNASRPSEDIPVRGENVKIVDLHIQRILLATKEVAYGDRANRS